MKLDKLWISEFKNLKDIEIDFDQNELVTVVIGWNGAGKSNVIEALVIIFRDLDLHKAPSFSYKLEYLCRGNRVIVEANEAAVKKDQYKVLVHVEGSPEEVITDKQTDFFKDKTRQFLPSNVFGYYSGPSDRLAMHFYDHQRKFRDQLLYPEKHGLNETTLPLRPLFYAQKVHSNFVLLSFFLGADEKVKKFLKEKLFIEGIESVLFVLNKPDWTSKKGDSRFWNASGVVRPFLDRLFSASLAPMRRTMKVPHPMKKNADNIEALFLYLKDLEALKKVGDKTSDKDFFKLLESIYFSNLIHEVRIRVKVKNKNGTDESLTFRELSEGEQQLITVLGLLRFTRDDESLFLLDEPDTHLNPAWSMEYINFLKEVAGFNLDVTKEKADFGAVDNSHIVLATHDPIVISTLKQEQIKIMKRDEDSLQVFAASPLYEPKGMGFSGILMSDMFGLRSDLDPKTLEKLDEHAILLAKDERTDEEESRYQELQEQLDKSGFLDAYSDPYFSAFVKAWGRKHGDKLFTQTFLSDRDRQQLADMTDDILAELDAEEADE
ncbi:MULTISPECIES: AAA family ATPase [Vibrio]|uniref:AAA family ATPase n=1 Tax=Vibrio TaxID=662 RepID=UPI001592F90A|nr:MULTISPECIES: AAA family ATPase [Vibrio]EIF2701185.1 AAA family ATPase [Vibrio alginolyticus]MBS9813072.1 AAA family ATPase [Vibrio alginolyticus]MBS9904188.1 AAA family ATPase [Vibrio alginolyticus]MBS9982170.1 AAA family ATPase [Vibrio alginolyticus]MBT0065330.1 AAA family ATPase [Vibrio alginolyticus]